MDIIDFMIVKFVVLGIGAFVYGFWKGRSTGRGERDSSGE
jgi:hypothetical protein